MNKNINVLLSLSLFILVLYSLVPAFDIYAFGFLKGVETPYLTPTFMVGTIVVSIVLVFRMVHRWMAIKLVSNPKKLIFIAPISKTYLSRVRLYLFLENLHIPIIGLYFLAAHPTTVPLGIALFLGLLETIVFASVNANQRKMKYGITKQAVVVCSRDSQAFYFSGLRKLSLIQQAIYFEYKSELTLCFPYDAVETNQRKEFAETLVAQINTSKVFVSDTVKHIV